MSSPANPGKGRVLVGMSGGVDSSSAALLLLREGYTVEGATFLLREDLSCGGGDDIADAKRVCVALGIPHHILDYREIFRETVVEYFVSAYRRGATPNPCIACNRAVKFGAFGETAREMGFDYIATGHYAGVERDESGWLRLRKGRYLPKDQSYFLYALDQEQLARVLFPLERYTKEEVRALAEEAGLPVSRKAESQDICFVPGGDYRIFLESWTGESAPEGYFIDRDGNFLGHHQGLWRYTIGQRKGLGRSFGQPMFVSAIDAASGNVTLSAGEDLFTRQLLAADPRLNLPAQPENAFECACKIRYAARPAAATVYPEKDGLVRVVFREPQRAVTPGQAVVFYDGEYVLGGATIL